MSERLTFALALEGMPPKEGRPLEQMEYAVQLYHGREGNDDFGKCVQTSEPIMGEYSPKFDTVFNYDWTKGAGQLWRFVVTEKFHAGNGVAVDGHAPPVVVNVDDYVIMLKSSEGKGPLRYPLDGDNCGVLLIQGTQPFKFRLRGKNIPHKGAFGTKSDPYVECYWKKGSSGCWKQFHKTGYVKWSENPVWDDEIEFFLYVKEEPMMFKFRVLDKDLLTKDEYIGEVEVHGAELCGCQIGETLSVKLTGDPKGEATLDITLI